MEVVTVSSDGLDFIKDVVFVPYYLADRMLDGKELSEYDAEDVVAFNDAARGLLSNLRTPKPEIISRFRSVVTGYASATAPSIELGGQGVVDSDMLVFKYTPTIINDGDHENGPYAIVKCNADAMKAILMTGGNSSLMAMSDRLLDVLFECLGDDRVLGSAYFSVWWDKASKYKCL